MILFFAIITMFGWGDDDCPIDQQDVRRVDETFHPHIFRVYTDEAAANAPREPDNEKNDETRDPNPQGLID
jgi:hypothetical protein